MKTEIPLEIIQGVSNFSRLESIMIGISITKATAEKADERKF